MRRLPGDRGHAGLTSCVADLAANVTLCDPRQSMPLAQAEGPAPRTWIVSEVQPEGIAAMAFAVVPIFYPPPMSEAHARKKAGKT